MGGGRCRKGRFKGKCVKIDWDGGVASIAVLASDGLMLE